MNFQGQLGLDFDSEDHFIIENLSAGNLTITVTTQALEDLNENVGGRPGGNIPTGFPNVTPTSVDGTLDGAFGFFQSDARIIPLDGPGFGGSFSYNTSFEEAVTFTIATFFPGGDLGALVNIGEIGGSTYSIEIDLQPVPIPAAGLLFGTALAGGIAAGSTRRRRKARLRK